VRVSIVAVLHKGCFAHIAHRWLSQEVTLHHPLKPCHSCNKCNCQNNKPFFAVYSLVLPQLLVGFPQLILFLNLVTCSLCTWVGSKVLCLEKVSYTIWVFPIPIIYGSFYVLQLLWGSTLVHKMVPI